MIDVVKQEKVLSLEEVQHIIDDTFDGDVRIEDVGEGYRVLKVRRHSDISGASPADFAAEELRALAGFCLTAAEALDVASGYGPEVDLAVGRDDRRLVQIPGFEDVEILVSNSFGDDEVAVQKARECLATLTAGRPVRRPAEKPVEPAGLVRLSKVGRHEFDIAGVTDVRLVVLNQACPVAAEQEAHEALRSIGVRI